MPDPNPAAIAVARQLIRLRTRIAPSGSLRHRLLRTAYVPVMRLLMRRERAALHRHALTESSAPAPFVAAMRSLRNRSKTWPQHPRILLLKLDHLGDFIVALPAMARIREAFPEAVITVCCASWNSNWAEASGLADRVVTFDFFARTKNEWRGAQEAQYERFSAIGLGSFDLAIDLRHDPDTRPLLARVDAAVRIGFVAPEELGGACLDVALPDMEHISVSGATGRPVHAEMRLSLLAAAAIETFAAPAHPVRRIVTGASHLSPEAPFLILAPGAGSPIRVWPVERLAAVGRELAERYDLDVVLIGASGQIMDCERMAALLPAERVHNLAGKSSVAALPALIQQARLFVGYDSGTSHLAASLGVPTVVVMGSIGNPEVWRVNGARAIALTTDIACAGCYLNTADECVLNVRCLDVISVEQVLAACETVLTESAGLADGISLPGQGASIQDNARSIGPAAATLP